MSEAWAPLRQERPEKDLQSLNTPEPQLARNIKMVAWDRAFRAAGLTILYSILWGILGTIFCVFGLLLVSSAAPIFGEIRGIQEVYPMVRWPGVIGGTILFLVGILIMYLGGLATVYKFLGELVAHEVGSRGASNLTVSPADKPFASSTHTTYSVCPKCGTSTGPGQNFCKRCGTKLSS